MSPKEIKLIIDVILNVQENILKQIAILDKKIEEANKRESQNKDKK